MTPTYLLVGISVPIWLSSDARQLSAFAGLVSIGVGDAAAAIVGRRLVLLFFFLVFLCLTEQLISCCFYVSAF